MVRICAGLQRYIREKRMKDNCKVPVDIYKIPLFAYFRGVFDSQLKELHQQGIRIYKKYQLEKEKTKSQCSTLVAVM